MPPFIGDVLTSKDKKTGAVREGSFYLKVTGLKDGQTLTLKNGDIIDMRKPEVFYEDLEAAGVITPVQRKERLGKTPDFVKLKAGARQENIK